MTILTPQTGSIQSFKIRTRPSASNSPFTVSLFLTDEETNVTQSITPVSASYDSSDFLVVSASLYLTSSHFYKLQVLQFSGSTECAELYRGEIYATTQSATLLNSEPLLSYTDSSNDYIIYES